MRQTQKGFTLLEVLVSIAVAAVLLVSAIFILRGLNSGSQRLRLQQQHITMLLTGMQQMHQDLANLVPFKRAGGNLLLFAEPLDGSQLRALTFSSLQPSYRTSIVRIAWRLQNGVIYRQTSLAPQWQAILTGVQGWSLRFYQQGSWQNATGWQPLPPSAIELTVTLSDLGTYQRLILLRGRP
ncbi:type II secretion system protein GspJ [Dickeya dadantii]|uniref:Type II secretion system protein J n=1 Tax=Dickeya dadantii (strain 3937) TaxID=198628 RepID=E0SG42_DICD3|nr:type II secretion system protein GspJ [Dickeya dadantii]ADM98897.1 General secretion pathway protein J [Dickeya dadantii 3937]UAY94770.1 prepilin-type N-terminal cleavage/methylation domain-containing protein [Dickeya dadantii]